MKRYRTRVTVWPAITDLMTTVVIVALLTSVLIYFERDGKSNAAEPSEIVNVDSLLQETDASMDAIVEALRVSNNLFADTIETLRDSIDTLKDVQEGSGAPDCLGDLGENEFLLTIRFDPGSRYHIRLNDLSLEALDWAKLRDYAVAFDRKMLTQAEMIDFAKKLKKLGGDYKKCNFYVNIENGGIHPDSFKLRWLDDLSPYFIGASNWWVIRDA